MCGEECFLPETLASQPLPIEAIAALDACDLSYVSPFTGYLLAQICFRVLRRLVATDGMTYLLDRYSKPCLVPEFVGKKHRGEGLRGRLLA
jgi:hypothetical protein